MEDGWGDGLADVLAVGWVDGLIEGEELDFDPLKRLVLPKSRQTLSSMIRTLS